MLGENYVNELPTNFLAYQEGETAGNQEEKIQSASQYIKIAKEVINIKKDYVQPLMPINNRKCASERIRIMLKIIRYFAFSVPFFIFICAYLTSVFF